MFGAAFYLVEHRVRRPILDFSLFRRAPFSGSVFVAFVASSVVSLAIGIPATRAYGIVGSVWGTNLADAGALLMVLWLLRRKIVSRPELVGVEG